MVSEFTHQSETFNASFQRAPDATLAALVAAAGTDGRWLDAACGPGLITRALSAYVDGVHGIDLTPAMIDVARREAADAGLTNATFARGDATALEFADASFDGALTRFSVHHMPRPGRMVCELARVVRPGGSVLLGDHVADTDADAAAWAQEIERLRDPSHWACLTPARLCVLGERAGLRLEHQEVVPFAVDYEDWITRASGGPRTRALIEEALAERPDGAESFAVARDDDGVRRLHLRFWLGRFRR